MISQGSKVPGPSFLQRRARRCRARSRSFSRHARRWRRGRLRWPGHAETLLQLGVLLAQRGQLAEGLDCLSRSVQGQPGNARARNNLGVALAQAGRPQEAIEQLQEAWRLEPGYAEAGYNLGNV